MSDQASRLNDQHGETFAQEAEQAAPGFLVEFWDFLCHQKKWWLTPIIILLLLLGALIFTTSPAALVIYTLF